MGQLSVNFDSQRAGAGQSRQVVSVGGPGKLVAKLPPERLVKSRSVAWVDEQVDIAERAHAGELAGQQPRGTFQCEHPNVACGSERSYRRELLLGKDRITQRGTCRVAQQASQRLRRVWRETRNAHRSIALHSTTFEGKDTLPHGQRSQKGPLRAPRADGSRAQQISKKVVDGEAMHCATADGGNR